MTPPQRPEPIRDTKSSLYEAALAYVKAQEEAAARAPRTPPPKPRRRSIRVLLMLSLVGLVLLVLQPDWLAGPKVPAESPGIAAASLRLALLRERQRVLDFIHRMNRLPASLAEAGDSASGFTFGRIGEAFRISGRAGDSLITLTDSDSAAAFLGNSLKRLKERSP